MSHENNEGTPLQPEAMSPSLEEAIISDPSVSWETSTELRTANTEAVWERIKHMGLVGSESEGGEDGAGWGIPARYNLFLPKRLQSTPTIEGTRAMEVGTRVRDVPEGSYVVAREVSETDMSILWESDWPQKSPDEEPMHYTYRVTVEPGPEGATIIKTSMRAANVSHPRLMRMFGPGIDGRAMKVFGEGLTELVDPEQAKLIKIDRVKRRIGYAGIVGVGIVGWRLLKNRKHRQD